MMKQQEPERYIHLGILSVFNKMKYYFLRLQFYFIYRYCFNTISFSLLQKIYLPDHILIHGKHILMEAQKKNEEHT